MLTRDSPVSPTIISVVAGDPTKDGFFDNGYFVFVGAWDARGEGIRLRNLNAERSVLNLSVVG